MALCASAREMSTPVRVRIHALKAGRWPAHPSDVVFSDDDVEAIARSYDPTVYKAPVVLGHPTTDAPAWGWVEAVEADADGLWLEATLQPELAELVREGRYRHVSVALWPPDAPGNPKPGSWYLRHLGFLGAAAPAVKGLQPVELGDGDGVVEVTFAERLSTRPWSEVTPADWADAESYCRACLVDLNPPGEPKAKARCKLPVREPDGTLNRNALIAAQGALVGARGGVELSPEEKRRAARKLVRLMREHGLEPADSLLELAAERETRRMSETDEREVKLAERERELEARLRALEERERALRRAELAREVDEHVRAGRVLPAERDRLLLLMERLDGEVVTLAEGEKPALELFREFLAGLPARVPLGEAAGERPPRPRIELPQGFALSERRRDLWEQVVQVRRTNPELDVLEAVRLARREEAA